MRLPAAIARLKREVFVNGLTHAADIDADFSVGGKGPLSIRIRRLGLSPLPDSRPAGEDV